MDNSISVSTTDLRKDLARYLQEASEGRTVYIYSRGFRVAALVHPAGAEQANRPAPGDGS